jgi:formate dehydrogenase gamma subunit
MYISNRGAACGTCHGKVTKSFSMSFSHKRAMEYGGSFIENLIKNIYIVIIIVSVVGMLIHNLIIWFWAVKRKHSEQRQKKQVRRMTAFEIVSHLVLFLSFTGLAVTGLALKFPEWFWVRWLFSIGMTESVRAIFHRLLAVIMTLDLLMFILYMVSARRGRGILKASIPGKQDFSDFFKTMNYFLGRLKERPKFGIFNYAEKFEFWALFWGVAVMAVTGFILWFPKTVPATWPAWIINVARIIHFYEALLATLSILIWHGFHTMFHPEEYPMSTTWLTGYITDEEASHRYREEAIAKMSGEHEAETPKA